MLFSWLNKGEEDEEKKNNRERSSLIKRRRRKKYSFYSRKYVSLLISNFIWQKIQLK